MARDRRFINFMARAACAALIVLAASIGAYRHIADLRAEAWRQYAYIEESLRDCAASAHNLSVVALRHLPADEPELVALLSAKEGLEESIPSPDRAFLENRLLTEAAVELESRLRTAETFAQNDTDGRLASNVIAEIRSANSKIGHESYNDAALAYNRHIAGFPQSGVAAVAGIRGLPLYR